MMRCWFDWMWLSNTRSMNRASSARSGSVGIIGVAGEIWSSRSMMIEASAKRRSPSFSTGNWPKGHRARSSAIDASSASIRCSNGTSFS